MRQNIQRVIAELQEEQRQLDQEHQIETSNTTLEEDRDYLEERYQMVDIVLWSSITQLQKALANRRMQAKVQEHLTHLRDHIQKYEQRVHQQQPQRRVAKDSITKEREIVKKLEKLLRLKGEEVMLQDGIKRQEVEGIIGWVLNEVFRSLGEAQAIHQRVEEVEVKRIDDNVYEINLVIFDEGSQGTWSITCHSGASTKTKPGTPIPQ
jgi:hypothetical protein